MMHKKVYVDFARMIRSQRHKAAQIYHNLQSQIHEDNYLNDVSYVNGIFDSISDTVEKLAVMFAQDNSQFNAEKFMKACEIDTESK